MSDLLGPKRLDFEVIDFDQFGAQPPDLPLNDNLKKVHHHGGISSFNGGKGVGTSTKAKKPEHHLRALDSRNGIEQGAFEDFFPPRLDQLHLEFSPVSFVSPMSKIF